AAGLPALPHRGGPALDRPRGRSASLAAGGDVVTGPLLEVRGVHKNFGVTEALRGADLSVVAGEVVAVSGPSGSGRSTLLHCAAGILAPDAGEVLFDGRRLDTMSDRQRSVLRRRMFGFVFQFGQLVPELPAVENVALPLLLNGEPRAAAIRAGGEWF